MPHTPRTGSNEHMQLRKPAWLRRSKAHQGKFDEVNRLVTDLGLHTVCKEASCPNRSECFSCGTATFLVMGSTCTRGCLFCGVGKEDIAPVDFSEIERVALAVKKMNLKHTVITSVTRDDLGDGGASFFADLVGAVRRECPGVTVELLIPDLKGDTSALAKVFNSRPDILNHNIETVPLLYAELRPQARYERSMAVLAQAAESGLVTKSGIMVGLGETADQVKEVLKDLHQNGCRIVTIGQYLQPSSCQVPVREYVAPERFEEYRAYGSDLGFYEVVAGPFVRSSYHAAEMTRYLDAAG